MDKENCEMCMYIYIYIHTYIHTHTHTMEYHSAIKNEIILFVDKSIELENIMLSEISQAQKINDLVFPRIWKLDL
jgi:hypothetical protein